MRTFLASSVFLALSATLLVATSAHAAPGKKKCKVENLDTGVKYTIDLQTAIDDATAGDVLEIKGVCKGNFTINKDLTLLGKGTNFVNAALDGDHAGRVLDITGGTVLIENLTIRNGSSNLGGGHS